MGNEYRDYQRLVLVNGVLGFDMSHVNDFNLQDNAMNPLKGVMESCVRITFDNPEDDSKDPAMFVFKARATYYFGTDAAALRAFIPTYCMKANAPKPS